MGDDLVGTILGLRAKHDRALARDIARLERSFGVAPVRSALAALNRENELRSALTADAAAWRQYAKRCEAEGGDAA
jgi:hypothetical protein